MTVRDYWERNSVMGIEPEIFDTVQVTMNNRKDKADTYCVVLDFMPDTEMYWLMSSTGNGFYVHKGSLVMNDPRFEHEAAWFLHL